MNSQAASPAIEERMADAAITTAIERLFLLRRGVHPDFIQVTCREGMVQLTGFTDNLLSGERAAEIAQAVRGVRGVINELSIRTPDVPDAELLRRVELALLQDPAAGDYNVRCNAHDGVLTVAGTVQSWTEQQLVLRVLKGVPGVRQLVCELNSRGGEVSNSDEEITTLVREVLLWDLRVKSALVDIRTNEGGVRLSGSVGSAAEREQVITTAYVAGARRVDARDLFVVRAALDPVLRRQKFAAKADEDVARAVRDALYYDPRVRAFTPVVRVHDGKVTLAGTVSNLRAREAAGQDAGNVVGVWEVLNLLQVRAQYPSPDAGIQEQVKLALSNDAFVGHYDFTVNVSNGKVMLYGAVNSHFDQERVAVLASGIIGVIELESHVTVASYREETFAPLPDSQPRVAHDETAADYLLEQRLRNHFYWSALLHDQAIDIRVLDGRATLTGTVDSPLEQKQAGEAALLCGAREVNNHLHFQAAD